MNQLSRRTLILSGLAIAGSTALTACTGQSSSKPGGSKFVIPKQTPLAPKPGQRVVTASLNARATTIDLGGTTVPTWAYGDTVPGPVIRATAGDLLRVTVTNNLEAETSVHWHGIALRHEADGVPGLTQEPISSNESFVYEFVAPDPGTYFYHPHVGVQLDRGLYAPLVIDDPDEPGAYDTEWIVVLDDWIDGTGTTPDDVLADLTAGSSGDEHSMDGMDMGDMDGMEGMDMGSSDSPFGDAGDVTYPHYLINGRTAQDPDVLKARPGQRIRLRIINAAADTIFAVALGGHRLTLTDSDGFPLKPTDTDGFYIGMGERYDCIATLEDGVFPLVAQPVGKEGQALALIRTGSGAAPAPDVKVAELNGAMATVGGLEPAESARLPTRRPGQSVELTLTGQMSPYAWAINGAAFPDNQPIEITPGERVQVRLTNQTMMTHPMHIHGHTFALPNGVRKDTVLLTPMQRLDVELQADNPGNWAAHCHNIYHAEAGMMAALVYES